MKPPLLVLGVLFQAHNKESKMFPQALKISLQRTVHNEGHRVGCHAHVSGVGEASKTFQSGTGLAGFILSPPARCSCRTLRTVDRPRP